MEAEERLRLSALLMMTVIREFKTLEPIFTTTSSVPDSIQASLSVLPKATSLSSAITGVLEAMESICAFFAQTDSCFPQLSLYVRKAEISSLNFHMIESLEDYPTQFLPLSYLRNSSETRKRSATLVSSEGFLSQSFLLTGTCYLGSPVTSTLHNALRTSLKLVKEPDLVAVSEGPSTLPNVRWELDRERDYPLHSGALFRVGETMLAVHSVKAGRVLLRWKVTGEVYTPLAQLVADQKTVWVIGRHPSCDILINHPKVSSRHAHIRSDGSAWLIRDLGSSNGTFQYLHTRFTLSGDSGELLVRDESRLFVDEKDLSLLVSFSPS